MIVFYYDKTFEGLLTAVFDAYSRKSFPSQLLAIGEVAPLFVEEEHTVVTDVESAKRVWHGLERRLSHAACSMLTNAWLSEEKEIDLVLFQYIRKCFDSTIAGFEMNFGDEDVLHLLKVAKRVGHEAHYLVMFIRFQKANDELFFAPVSPKCNALPLVIDHFTDRFSDQKWLIYDVKRHYGFYYNLSEVKEVTLEDDEHLLTGELDEALMADDEKLFQNLWKGYFGAMTIKERINPHLQRQHMPKRFWKFLTEKQK